MPSNQVLLEETGHEVCSQKCVSSHPQGLGRGSYAVENQSVSLKDLIQRISSLWCPHHQMAPTRLAPQALVPQPGSRASHLELGEVHRMAACQQQ